MYCNACRKYFETFLTIIRVIYPLIDHNNYLYSIQQMRECKRERYLFHQKLIYTNTNTNILSAQTQLQWYMSCIYVWIWLTAWVHIFHINGRLLIHVQLKYLKTIVFICYNYWYKDRWLFYVHEYSVKYTCIQQYSIEKEVTLSQQPISDK